MVIVLEWLFTDGYDNCPGTTCPWKDSEMADSHVSAIASAISSLHPDFLDLAEVESCDDLTKLINDPELLGKGYLPYMIQGKDSSTGQDVGLLTLIDPIESLYRSEARVIYPIPTTTCNSTYTGDYGVSKHYITSFKVNDIFIAVISMHLLAFPDDQNRCVQREAQAVVMQQVVEPYLAKGYEVIIVGDMNDFDNDVIDANDNIPISQVMSILKGSNMSWKLTNVALRMDKAERYSDWYDENDDCVYINGETSMIDHILVSDGLLNRITYAGIAHDLYTQSCSSDFYYSDHWPVVVVSTSLPHTHTRACMSKIHLTPLYSIIFCIVCVLVHAGFCSVE